MPMINCPECSKLISDRMKKCPQCGHEFSMPERYSNFYEKSEDTYKENYGPQNTHFYVNPSNTYPQNNISDYNKQDVMQKEIAYKVCCPRCGSENISYQREQMASFGAGTNKVVIQQEKKSKGCLWWMCIGFWWVPMYWLLIGWWWRPLFGGRTKSGLNFNANKSINRTMAVCQNCGNSWKVK